MIYSVGDKIPVWWYTGEYDGNGNNLATVLDVRPYIGPLEFCDSIVKLNAPRTSRGWLEMTITK